MGRNGVGKTTLLKAVMGLLRPRGGTIRLDGARIDGLPPFRIARAGIAYVPQGREVFADLTVEENLILGDLMAADAGRGYALFPALAERRREPAGRLSGGQQQQLAIARALMARPRLLLLDEPSEGVQPSVVMEMADALAAVAVAEGMAVVLVEQNVDMALRLAGRVVFMDRGRVVAEERADDLRADPARLDAHLVL
jgi:ABC-type branched-subunit amino acid transport system ATPase component